MKNRQRYRNRALFIAVMLAVSFFGQGSAIPEAARQDSFEVQDPSAAPAKEEAARTELHRAALAGNLEILQTQLGQGRNPDARDSEGRTPLMEAVKAGQIEAARTLLTAGASINAASRLGRTALIEAAESGQNEAARLLIDAGADLNARQRGVGTALEAAERAGNNELAAALLRAGARSSGRSVGDTVCVRPWNGDGYCGVVEEVSKTTFRIRVTELVGCENGCSARAECSESKPVGSSGGIQVGDVVTTVSWCLTHTGVLR